VASQLEAVEFLKLLVELEAIELASTPTEECVDSLAEALAIEPAKERADAVWEWLLTKDCIDEVFPSEYEMGKLVKKW